jgi:hypothetical protein
MRKMQGQGNYKESSFINPPLRQEQSHSPHDEGFADDDEVEDSFFLEERNKKSQARRKEMSQKKDDSERK